MATALTTPHEILDFWFIQTPPVRWWNRQDDFDRLIAQRYAGVHAAATRCELYRWRETPAGRLAEILVIDQFSRNLYRDDPRAYANDALALALAQTAVALQLDRALSVEHRAFLYMPYMHSESAAIHAVAMELFGAPGLEASLVSEIEHRAQIERFGRYPHRNAALGRACTPQETAFLAQGGSRF